MKIPKEVIKTIVENKEDTEYQKDCAHKRIKRTFPHGRNAAPVRKCKDCDKVLTLLELNKEKKFRKNRPSREQEEYPENYMEKKI